MIRGGVDALIALHNETGDEIRGDDTDQDSRSRWLAPWDEGSWIRLFRRRTCLGIDLMGARPADFTAAILASLSR